MNTPETIHGCPWPSDPLNIADHEHNPRTCPECPPRSVAGTDSRGRFGPFGPRPVTCWTTS